MTQPPLVLDDPLLAAILATGLRHNVVAREDVVSWADSEIEKRADVPLWLIDLSLSQKLFTLDIISLLNGVAGDVAGLAVCRGIYSLVPDPPADYTYDQYGTLAKHLYRLAYRLLDGNWKLELLKAADIAADNFAWVRDGYYGRIGDRMVSMDRDGVLSEFRMFLQEWKDQKVQDRLRPVRYLLPMVVEEYD